MCFWWSLTKRKWLTIVPKLSQPGESRSVDDEAGEIGMGLDLRIDRLRQLDKIGCVERRLRSHQQDGMRGIEIKFNHGLLLNELCRMDRRGWFCAADSEVSAQQSRLGFS
jgi:hypothetical protein